MLYDCDTTTPYQGRVLKTLAKAIEPYIYTPIAETGGIRLIQLQPSEDQGAIIRCQLIHTTLAQVQREIIDHYAALLVQGW